MDLNFGRNGGRGSKKGHIHRSHLPKLLGAFLFPALTKRLVHNLHGGISFSVNPKTYRKNKN